MSRRPVGDHPRNTGPTIASARCGAKTRSGAPCRAPAVQGRARCRMHGGAPGTGAPAGNRNALKHGMFTREEIEERQLFNQMMRKMRETLEEFEK